jgi:nodulation protein E
VRRVAVTGIGIVSPFGRGAEATVDALRHGRSAIRAITSIDTSALNCRIAGEVPAEGWKGLHRGHDRFTRLALIAAEDAVSQSGELTSDPSRFGVIIGTGLGGCETQDASYKRFYGEGARIPPMAIPQSMYNAAAAAVSIRFGARGVSYTVVSACASAAHAVGVAMQAIREGRADVVLAGGSDAPLVPGVIRAWEGLRVMSIDNENPAEACRPFSGDRQGFVLAEGAAMFVLESFEHAVRRGAPMLAEIAGFGATSDAAHLTDPSLEGGSRAMRLALEDARMTPADIGYVNAHGTATRANDATETAAIREVFGNSAPPVSSTKSMHGHAMGASGAIEIAGSILALRAGFLPPTINRREPDPSCDLDYVTEGARPARIGGFLSNSFGFGGANAVVAVRLLDPAMIGAEVFL